MKLEIDKINLSNFSKKFILISLDILIIIFLQSSFHTH